MCMTVHKHMKCHKKGSNYSYYLNSALLQSLTMEEIEMGTARVTG